MNSKQIQLTNSIFDTPALSDWCLHFFLTALCLGHGPPGWRSQWHLKSHDAPHEHCDNRRVWWCYHDTHLWLHLWPALWKGIWRQLCSERKGQWTEVFGHHHCCISWHAHQSCIFIWPGVSVAGAATSIIFGMNKVLSQQTYFCRNKTFVMTDICCNKHNFVVTKLLS